jgi:DNA-binding transcriptional LysR family regulator
MTSTASQPPKLTQFDRVPPALRGADLPLLSSLDILLDECNVTRAAVRLHLSQPALSAQLSRLRVLFNDPLLVPAENGRGLVASPFALRLRSRLQPALADLSEAVRFDSTSFSPDITVRTFNVAAANTAASLILPGLAQRFGAYGNPGLKFAVMEKDPALLTAELEKGAVDLCLSPACWLPPGLSIRELITTPFVMAQRSDHPRGNLKPTLDEYCSLTHINVSPSSSLHSFIDQQLYRQGRSRQVCVTVRDFGSVPAMLRASDLVCTMPARFGETMGPGFDLIDIPFWLTPYVLCVAWHPRHENDPGLCWLRDELSGAVARSSDKAVAQE